MDVARHFEYTVHIVFVQNSQSIKLDNFREQNKIILVCSTQKATEKNAKIFQATKN